MESIRKLTPRECGWLRSRSRVEDLKEIVAIMKQHGISSREMIGVYGFDENVVNLSMKEC